MERERDEAAVKDEFREAVTDAILRDDAEFAIQLMESREVEPPKMIQWLERQAEQAEPEQARSWYGFISEYARHYLSEGSYGIFGDVSRLEKARDRADAILARAGS